MLPRTAAVLKHHDVPEFVYCNVFLYLEGEPEDITKRIQLAPQWAVLAL